MTVQDDLKTALRELMRPSARAHGFKGSAPNWRRASPQGDWAVVNVQSSTSSTSRRGLCYLNVAVVPEPCLRWDRERLGAHMPRHVTESLGLWRDRLRPTVEPWRSEGRWEFTDLVSARAAVVDMVAQLEAGGWEQMTSLLDQQAMLDQVRAGDLGFFKLPHHEHVFARAEALLLMEAGPSGELDAQLARARRGLEPSQVAAFDRFEAWVRQQAARTT